MTIFVVENMERSRQHIMFKFLGVEYYATPRAWVNLPAMLLLGIVLAFLLAPGDDLWSSVISGVVYGFILMISNFCHGVGHILSSRWVGAPVSSILETATVYVTRYDDKGEVPSKVHIGRALGGPLMNLLLGTIALILYLFVFQNHFILFFAVVNLVIGLLTLLPIPTVDGAVIWRELFNWSS